MRELLTHSTIATKSRLRAATYFGVALTLFAMLTVIATSFCSLPEALASEADEWTVQFDLNGAEGSIGPIMVNDGVEYCLPECPSALEGMTFDGWVLWEPSDALVVFQPGDTVIADRNLSFFASWKASAPEEGYVLTLQSNFLAAFYVNGEVFYPLRPITVKEGDTLTVAVFTGENGVGLYDWDVKGVEFSDDFDKMDLFFFYDDSNQGFTFQMPACDVTIMALYYWSERTVSFEANGGTGTMEPLIFRGDSVTLPECGFSPPEGMEFDAWLLPYSSSAIVVPGYTLTFIEKQVTIKALWRAALTPEHIHELVAVKAIQPTCEDAGQNAYWKCEGCGKLFADEAASVELASLEEIPALGHDWDEWEVVQEPTATDDGERVRVCKRDDTHHQSEILPATGQEPEGTDKQPDSHEAVDSVGESNGTEDTPNVPDNMGPGEPSPESNPEDNASDSPKSRVWIPVVIGVGAIGATTAVILSKRNRTRYKRLH